MVSVDEVLLDEKLEVMETSHKWAPRAISKLETFIRTADDYDLYKINPVSYAKNRGTVEKEATELFLWAAKEGIFAMNWGLVCPTCGDDVGSFRSLKKVSNHFFCNVCRVESTACLDEHIMVTFTVNPSIRKIAYHDPDSLSIEDYVNKYHYSREGKIPDTGETFPEFIHKYIREYVDLKQNEKTEISMEVEEGYLLGFDLKTNAGFCITIEKDYKTKKEISIVLLDGEYIYNEEMKAPPGKINFEIMNGCSENARMVVLFEPPVDPTRQQPNLVFDEFLTGKMLLSNHTFNTLFRNEMQVGSEGIKVKDITILFTDLKGSTEIYERIGDMQAFSLVSQHFQLLEKIVATHEGSIVKTIGDAIMATFLNPVQAMQAAIKMNNEIADFNRKTNNQDLILKIGVHKGPSIAVTLNQQLDYFGRTVNIASRIQHLANPEEINVTNDIYQYSGLLDAISGYNADPIQVQLKGMQDEMQIYRIYKE
ncbi:MAG: DUF5939 domain-containing protein [Leptospirales bacterium]